MEVSEAKLLKTLEDENTKLKRLIADAMLENAAFKESRPFLAAYVPSTPPWDTFAGYLHQTERSRRE